MTRIITFTFMLVLLTAFAEGVAWGEEEPRNWQHLRKLVVDAEDRNIELVNRAMAEGLRVDSSVMNSNSAPVQQYLLGLSRDDLFNHVRGWISNTKSSEQDDPYIIVWLCLGSLKNRSEKVKVADFILRIIADKTESQEFRAALIQWWGEQLVSSDKDAVSQEAQSMRIETTTVVLDILTNTTNPDIVRTSALDLTTRLLLFQRRSVVENCKSLGILCSTGKVERIDMIALVKDDGSSIDIAQRMIVRSFLNQQRELVKGANSLVDKKDLAWMQLNKIRLLLSNMQSLSLNDEIKLSFDTLEGKVIQKLASCPEQL